MKVVSSSTYNEACRQAMDIVNKNKTSRNKKRMSDLSSNEDSEGESWTIQALYKDMMCMMKEMRGGDRRGEEAKEKKEL